MTTFATPPSAWDLLDRYEAVRIALGGDPDTPVNTRDTTVNFAKPPSAEQMYTALGSLADAADALVASIPPIIVLEVANEPLTNGVAGTGIGDPKMNTGTLLIRKQTKTLYINAGDDTDAEWVRFQRNEGVDE